MKRGSQQGVKAAVPAGKAIMERMEVKILRSTTAPEESQFLNPEKLAFCKPGIEKVCKILRASMAIHMYAVKDS